MDKYKVDKYKVGDLIGFVEEKQRYTIRACDNRYLICTKPFNLKHTVLYTIVDLKKGIRGTDNLVFGFGYETSRQCGDNLKLLQDGIMEISKRNQIILNFAEV